MAKNNCTNPPHFPPHCGCPAGFHPGEHEKTGDGGEQDSRGGHE